MRPLCLVLALLCAPALLGAQADSTTRPPGAFTMVEVRRFGVTVVAGSIAYLGDQALRDALQRPGVQSSELLDGAARFGNAYGAPGVLVLGAAMWGGGLVAKRPVLATAGLRAIEAITVSGLVTQGLKVTAGRARPFTSPDNPADWKLFRADDPVEGSYASMASGHATAAFAFASAVTATVKRRAPERARAVGIITYGAAAVTAYARMHDDKHWLSDVTVGAGIGTVTGWAITRWHDTRPDNPIDRVFLRPFVAPAHRGATMIGVTFSTR